MKIRTTIRALVFTLVLSFGSAWAMAASHVKVSGKTGESTFFALNDRLCSVSANSFTAKACNQARACRYSMYLDSSLYRPRLTPTAR